MGDKTLREDFGDLKGTVKTFCAVQESWNIAHDKHSREVLAGIEKRIDKLFTMQETMLEKFSTLPCAEHDVRIQSAARVTKAQIISIEKRIKWLWGILGTGVGAVTLGFFLKIILSYLKSPVV